MYPGERPLSGLVNDAGYFWLSRYRMAIINIEKAYFLRPYNGLRRVRFL